MSSIMEQTTQVLERAYSDSTMRLRRVLLQFTFTTLQTSLTA